MAVWVGEGGDRGVRVGLIMWCKVLVGSCRGGANADSCICAEQRGEQRRSVTIAKECALSSKLDGIRIKFGDLD